MTQPLTDEERAELKKWAIEVWDDGEGSPELMKHVLDVLRYEATLEKGAEQLGYEIAEEYEAGATG